MPGSRKILTVHSPVVPSTLDALLTGVEEALTQHGADRVWIDSTWSPDLVVMAEFAVPEVRPAVQDLVGQPGEAADAVDAVAIPQPR